MVVYTEYDSDLKEKVFAVRGAERYTHSTICNLEYEYYNNHASYLTVDLTASVEHHVGSSTVAFYEDNVLMGIKTITQRQSSVSFSVRTTYGVHLYQAKFLGNAECLSSKSRFISVEVLEPDLPTPTLNITNAAAQSLNGTSTFNVALANSGINLSNKTVTIYVDDEEYSTKTVTGVTSVTVSSLTVGKHTIKAVFDGDDEYLATENSFEVMVGYDLSVTANHKLIAFGDTLIIDAYLDNWNGEPISGSTISLVGLNTSATTDSEGHARLTWEATQNVTEITVRNAVSNTDYQLPMTVVYPATIDMYAESVFAYEGNSIPISITPLTASMSTLPNCLVTVNGVKYHTNSYGTLDYIYEGTGGGKATITASVGGVSNSIDIIDVLMYWSVAKKIKWDRISNNGLAISEQHAGLRMESPATSLGELFLFPAVNEGSITNINWVFEFTVKSSTSSAGSSSGLGSGDVTICGTSFRPGQLAPNSKVRVEKIDDVVSTYVDNDLKNSTSVSIYYMPRITLNMANVLIIDEVSLARLVL